MSHKENEVLNGVQRIRIINVLSKHFDSKVLLNASDIRLIQLLSFYESFLAKEDK